MEMEPSVNFKEELLQRTEEAEQILVSWLPAEEGFAENLARSMNYSMLAGGKRLRPILMRETYRMFGGTGPVIEPFMAGMEMIHTHSLIHDDLPALDGDEYRRGKQTTWVAFGESQAILAGDALLNLAYETFLRGLLLCGGDMRTGVRAMEAIASRTGLSGMLGGQSVDVENDGKPLELPALEYIYRSKTSALIEASMMAGAILAGAQEQKVEVIRQAALYIGMAFQIQDDILDLTSTDEVLGKPVGSDEKNHKITYVSLVGMDRALRDVEEMSEKALALMDSLEEENLFLSCLIRELIHRKK